MIISRITAAIHAIHWCAFGMTLSAAAALAFAGAIHADNGQGTATMACVAALSACLFVLTHHHSKEPHS